MNIVCPCPNLPVMRNGGSLPPSLSSRRASWGALKRATTQAAGWQLDPRLEHLQLVGGELRPVGVEGDDDVVLGEVVPLVLGLGGGVLVHAQPVREAVQEPLGVVEHGDLAAGPALVLEVHA